jgi:hypothetical protein
VFVSHELQLSDGKDTAFGRCIAHAAFITTPRGVRNIPYGILVLEDNDAYSETFISRFSDELLKREVFADLLEAKAARSVIARFGRHPHRNEILGGTSTPEELECLRTETPPHLRRPPS